MTESTGVFFNGIKQSPVPGNWGTYVIEITPHIEIKFLTDPDTTYISFTGDTFLSMLPDDIKEEYQYVKPDDGKVTILVSVADSCVEECAFWGEENFLHGVSAKNCFIQDSAIDNQEYELFRRGEMSGYQIIDSELNGVRLDGRGFIADSELSNTSIYQTTDNLVVDIKDSSLGACWFTSGNTLTLKKVNAYNTHVVTDRDCYIKGQLFNGVDIVTDSIDIMDVWGFFELNVKVETFYFVETSRGVFCYIPKNKRLCFSDDETVGHINLVSKTPIAEDGSNSLHVYLENEYGDVPFIGNFIVDVVDHLDAAYESRVTIIEKVRSLAGYGKEEG